jgi:glycosyltransferase involved in cell wall biosynthesis
VLAMSLGVPVVGTAVEGLPAVLGDERGVIVAPEEPTALARAIGDVLSGRIRTDLRAARRYARGFSPQAVAARYATAYRELCATSAARTATAAA